jgi:hypothetical protein
VPGAPLVVEFVGLPGAGKTTTEVQVTAALMERGVSAADRPSVGGQDIHRARHYARLGGFFLGRPAELGAAFRLARLGGAGVPAGLRDSFRCVSVWAWRLALARELGLEVLLLDQGPVQEGWALTLRGGWTPEAVAVEVARLVRVAGVSYALIHFDLPAQLAAERIARRPTMESGFDRLAPDEAQRRLLREEGRLGHLSRLAAAAIGARVLRIDATRPIADSVSSVEHFIMSLLGGTPKPECLRP